MKALVADDSAVTRLIVCSALRKLGFEVTQAADGGEACQFLERDDGPPLALIDWQMPQMDGTEVCRKMRGNSRARALYIILLSGRDNSGDIASALAAGADDYLTKPFEIEELHARVRVGVRVLELQQKLAERESELVSLRLQLKNLGGLSEREASCGR